MYMGCFSSLSGVHLEIKKKTNKEGNVNIHAMNVQCPGEIRSMGPVDDGRFDTCKCLHSRKGNKPFRCTTGEPNLSTHIL